MIQLLQFFLVATIFVTTSLLIYYSMLSRRQTIEPFVRFRYRALMNIQMGICFTGLASLQLTLQSLQAFQYVLIGLIYLIGLINLYYGIKRYRWSKHKESKKA